MAPQDFSNPEPGKSRLLATNLIWFPSEEVLLPPYEWGLANKMLDLTRAIDSVRKA